MQKTLSLIINGRVQGVWFRHNTMKKAIELDLKGYVRNLLNGNVEVVAQGSKEKLRLLLEWCKLGPKLSKVEDIQIKWEEYKNNYQNFKIKS